MIVFGVSTKVEQDDRHSGIIFRCLTSRFLAGFALQSRSTELRFDEEGLTAAGDLGGHKPGRLHLPWNHVRELYFAPAGRGETGGLYAREGACCARCILPRVAEGQARQVIASIAHRFPLLLRSTETEVECTAPLPVPSHLRPVRSLQLLHRGPTL